VVACQTDVIAKVHNPGHSSGSIQSTRVLVGVGIIFEVDLIKVVYAVRMHR